jgi:hypothetical protein
MAFVAKTTPHPPWQHRFAINGETIMEEARKREREGQGRVIDDGHPPALWEPKQQHKERQHG